MYLVRINQRWVKPQDRYCVTNGDVCGAMFEQPVGEKLKACYVVWFLSDDCAPVLKQFLYPIADIEFVGILT